MVGLDTLLGGQRKSQAEQDEEDMRLIQRITELRASLSKTQQHDHQLLDLPGIAMPSVARSASFLYVT